MVLSPRREHLAGYTIIEAKDLDQAIALAAGYGAKQSVHIEYQGLQFHGLAVVARVPDCRGDRLGNTAREELEQILIETRPRRTELVVHARSMEIAGP